MILAVKLAKKNLVLQQKMIQPTCSSSDSSVLK